MESDVVELALKSGAGLGAVDFGLSETKAAAENLQAGAALEGELKESAAAAARECKAVLAELLNSLSRRAANESALEIKQNVTSELRDELLRQRGVNDHLNKQILTPTRDNYGSDNFRTDFKKAMSTR